MVKQEAPDLDRVFAALSDATRRSVLARLSQPGGGATTVTELAQAHAMSLPGFMKHLAVLEAAGLISRAKEGRVVRCGFEAGPMRAAAQWLAHYEHFWTGQLDALGRYLHRQEELEPWSTPKPTTLPVSPSPATTPSRRRKSGVRGPIRKR